MHPKLYHWHSIAKKDGSRKISKFTKYITVHYCAHNQNNTVISALEFPRLDSGKSMPATSPRQTPSFASTDKSSCDSISRKLYKIWIKLISIKSHKSGNRYGSSLKPFGMRKWWDGTSSCHSKAWNVTFAVTVGKTGISGRKK